MQSDLEIYFVACDHTKPPRLQQFWALAMQSVSISLRSDPFWHLSLCLRWSWHIWTVFMICMELDDMTGYDITGWLMNISDTDSSMALIFSCGPGARFPPSPQLVPHAPGRREAKVCVHVWVCMAPNQILSIALQLEKKENWKEIETSSNEK